jgi:hypothetical protein
MNVSKSANLSLSQFVPKVGLHDGETVLIRVMKLPSVVQPVASVRTNTPAIKTKPFK